MTTYYAKADIDAYNAQLANYDKEHDVWQTTDAALQEQYEQAHADWQIAHDAWSPDAVDGDGNPIPEPIEPQRVSMPEPSPPAAPSTTYESRDVTEVETVATPVGDVLVMPGRIVMTGSDGSVFALSEAERDIAYGAAGVTPL